ncbi:MAG TPA: hypothetical protein VNK04_25290 [Gemmataceae bacterium]|nr:hypothetical protein [Gemmataceae bacterium]
MRTRMAWLAGFLMLAAGVLVTWPLTHGQSPSVEHPTSSPPPSTAPTNGPATGSLLGSGAKEHDRPSSQHPPVTAADGTRSTPPASQLTPLQQQMHLSALRGAEWLYRMNGPDGRFVPGYLPALKAVMGGDHYLRQVAAAFALARAARYTGEERYAARATQAVLTLLGETVVVPGDPPARHTSLPSNVINRLGAAGLLVAAINELPAPKDDLLEQSEQLCNFIRQQQQSDGSLRYNDSSEAGESAENPDGINHHPGAALYGLMLSQRYRPAAWKADVLRKALAYYRSWWKEHRAPAFVSWQAAAYTEAFLQTKEPAFAEFVSEMSDWLCRLQYDRIDPRRPLWYGGFREWADGRPVEAAPQVTSAAYAAALAEACRVARQQGDLARHRRYTEALERCLQFLATLQYTDANTQHFADWYRPALVGAFHASHEDGNLRLDYTQHAVCALVQYLTHVARPK